MDLYQSCFCFNHQVHSALKSSSTGSKSAVSEGVEASVIYVRFKAAANEVMLFFLRLFGCWKKVTSSSSGYSDGTREGLHLEIHVAHGIILYDCFFVEYMRLIVASIFSLSQCWKKLRADHPGKNMSKF